jgi:phage minor structural protein
MIPILYESSETEFVSEGLGRLSDAISCSVTEERNGSYELEMEYPVTGVHYSDIQLKRIISAIPADGKNRQSFVIYKISRPLDGKVTINAYHISYLLSGVITAPGSAKTVTEALLLLKNNALTNCPFEFWTDKETVANYSCDVPASIRSRLGGVTGSILDCYGGEYEWDNFTVKLHAHRGQDNGVRIAYGKNLTDIKQEESIESTVVGIYPYWKKDASDGEEAQLVTLDAPVYADNADNFPYKLVSVLDCSQEWQTAPTTDQLKAYAQSYIKNNDVGVPSVSIDVSFVALWQTEEYKNIAPLERVNLCDTVHVDFNTLGVSATAKVIETDYDVLSERYNSITIGNARASLSDTISNIESTATQTKKETTSFFQTAIANATKLIQGGLGGHVIFNTNADGQPNEILIMDTDDKNTAVNVIRMNVAGIGFSTTGYNGPFTTAWTINGAFNADFITAGTIRANLITAGILKDAKGNNYWNLDTGEFQLAALSDYSTTGETNDAIEKSKSEAFSSAKKYTDGEIESANGYTKTVEDALKSLDTQEGIFNALTDNGQTQGIYLKDKKLYINASYIKSGILDADLIKSGTIYVTSYGSAGIGGIYVYDGDPSNGHKIITIDSAGFEIDMTESESGLTPDCIIDFKPKMMNGVKIYNEAKDKITAFSPDKIILTTENNNATSILPCPSTKIDDGSIEITTATSRVSYFFYADRDLGRVSIAGDFSVNTSGGHTKSAIYETKDYGTRTLYCYETASPMFGDVGEGTIGDDGQCYVSIDPVFAETVSTSQYQVFLQAYGEGNVYVKERTPSYFVVCGPAGMSFGWEIKAKQIPTGQRRLESDDQKYTPEEGTDYAAEAAAHIQSITEEREASS